MNKGTVLLKRLCNEFKSMIVQRYDDLYNSCSEKQTKKDESLNSWITAEWKCHPCFAEQRGDKCWCTTVFANDEEIISYGEITKDQGQYIVSLHNNDLGVKEKISIPEDHNYNRNPYLEKWKVEKANFCRYHITTKLENKCLDGFDDKWYFIGFLNKDVALHIVRLHNNFCRRIKK